MNRPAHLLLFDTAPGQHDRRGLMMFALTYVGAFLCAGLLAYPVYQLFQYLGAGLSEDTFRGWLADQRMSRIADRLRLLAAAGGTLWLIGYAGLWGRFGFAGTFPVRRFLVWMAVGTGMLAIPVLLQLFVGQAIPREELDAADVAGIIAGAIAAALIVSFLEESIFRGMVLRLFATALPAWPAILLSSVLFAAVHFKSVSWMGPLEPSFESGWWIVGASFFAPVLTFQWILFSNLFLVGLVLTLLFWQTGNLIAGFGLHAGWVLAQRSAIKLCEANPEMAPSWLGSPKVTDGLLGMLLILLLAGWLCHDRIPARRRADELSPA